MAYFRFPRGILCMAANKKGSAKYKCFYLEGSWGIWTYEDESKLMASLSTMKK
jgi:hypothetical protein